LFSGSFIYIHCESYGTSFLSTDRGLHLTCGTSHASGLLWAAHCSIAGAQFVRWIEESKSIYKHKHYHGGHTEHHKQRLNNRKSWVAIGTRNKTKKAKSMDPHGAAQMSGTVDAGGRDRADADAAAGASTERLGEV
jgi:hypothetical protein